MNAPKTVITFIRKNGDKTHLATPREPAITSDWLRALTAKLEEKPAPKAIAKADRHRVA